MMHPLTSRSLKKKMQSLLTPRSLKKNVDPSAGQSLEDELIEDIPEETVSDDQESDISDAASENEDGSTDEDSIFTEDKTQMNPLPKKELRQNLCLSSSLRP